MHHFFHCEFAFACCDMLGILWPNTEDRFELMHQGRRGWHKPIFMEVFSVSPWNIWKERNDKLFKGVQPSHNLWLARFKGDFALLKHRANQRVHSFISSFLESIQ